MKFPFMKFFPRDWMGDERLRLCSLPARGLWIDMLCLMHSTHRRGYLQTATGSPLPLDQLARMTGCSTDEATRLLSELKAAGVFDCADNGQLIYSRRMVREESKREKCKDAGRKGGNPTLKGHPKGRAKGGDKGDFEPQSLRCSDAQKEEKKEDKEPPNPPVGIGITFPKFAELQEAWNAIDGVVPETHAAPGNRQMYSHRMSTDALFRERWRDGIDAVKRSLLCKGGKIDWKANLKWFLKEDTLPLLLNGSYETVVPPPQANGFHATKPATTPKQDKLAELYAKIDQYPEKP